MLALLVEDLDAAVAAVGDEQPALRVERQRSAAPRNSLGAVAVLAEALHELAVGAELRDAADAGRRVLIQELSVVRLGDEDAAVGAR